MCNPRILPNLSQQYVLIFCEKITNSDCSFSKNNLGNNYHVSKDTNKPLISRHTVNKWNKKNPNASVTLGLPLLSEAGKVRKR